MITIRILKFQRIRIVNAENNIFKERGINIVAARWRRYSVTRRCHVFIRFDHLYLFIYSTKFNYLFS